MTKKKSTTTNKPEDTITETEQTPGQKYETEIQQVVPDWPEKALQLPAEDILALEAPEGARKIKPRTADPALLRRLESIGGDAVNGWIVLPARPPAPQMPETLKAEPTGLDKAGFYDSEGRRIS
jgi:hypothetical protein